MPHYDRMLGRDLVECFKLDGWTAKYFGGQGAMPPPRALIKKQGHPSHGLTLTHTLSLKKVTALCKSAGISAEKFSELRAKVAAAIPKAAGGSVAAPSPVPRRP